MSTSIDQKLMELIRLPTVSQPSAFQEMVERTGWTKSRKETFDLAFTYLYEWLASFADEVDSQPVELQGFTAQNLWGLVKGSNNSEAILLEGHYDVVDANGTFVPEIKGGHLYGRGSTDMKGALVTALSALENIVRSGQKPGLDTYILLTCEEEVAARGAFAFAQNPPGWVNKVRLALCMESAYDEGELEFAIQHPGIACVMLDMPIEKVVDSPCWRIRVEPGKAHVLHASREPLTLDPNAVLLSILQDLPDGFVANLYSDRPIEGAANTTSYFSECVLSTTLNEETLKQLCLDKLNQYIESVLKEEQVSALKKGTILRIESVETKSCFEVSQFVDSVLGFRAEVQRKYSNALYGRPPFTLAAVLIQDGQAQVKIDIRTDAALRKDLDRLLAEHFPHPMQANVLWNDPVLDDPGIVKNKQFLQLGDVFQKYTNVKTTAHSGWTEAAVWSDLLSIPTVVVGPGQFGLAHTANEYIELDNMVQMITMLEEFLLYVEA